MPTNRLAGAAALNRIGVSAGTIASRNGRASATPAPRRNVRRGTCILRINMYSSVLTSYFLLLTSFFLLLTSCFLCPHLELRTLHHAQEYRRKAVAGFRRVAHDGT